ncbi:thymidylate synthase [Nonlabens arenilitoris]|uniref:Thymidylate synthase n=1 Tax=Nonlabens arenilitoris TaxID=1217969 RepID=A0A2S7U842_9FLAO|nr:thymidylate synthase [Nonlabens arenilitoris]PQJ31136.1 thymidylate synthase [Nonlabens arenilitoris]
MLPTDHIAHANHHFQYDFGNLYCFDHYVIGIINDQITVGTTEAKAILNDLNKYFTGKQFVYIANRAFSHNIDLSVYKLVNPKKLVGIAIVSPHENEINRAVEEQQLYSGSFGLFKNVESAIAWANTFQKVEG